MAAVQHWNGKKIDKSEANRQPGDQVDEGNDPFVGNFADDLADSDRSAEIVGAASPDDHLPYGRERARRDRPGLARSAPQRRQGILAAQHSLARLVDAQL